MPGPSGQGINSLLDLAQPALKAQGGIGFPSQFPNYSVPMGAQAPALYSGSGGGPGGSSPGGGGTRAFSPPPELAGFFDPFGNPRVDDPRKVASDAGITPADLARGFNPRGGMFNIAYDIPNDQGGFFTAEQLYGQPQQPQQPPGPVGANGQRASYSPRGAPPSIATSGQQLPSTNNWRLLGRGPGWIMRNGDLINMMTPEVSRGLPIGSDLGGGLTAEQGGNALFFTALGTGAPYGLPNMRAIGGPASAGWPGAAGWHTVFGGNV